MEPEDENFRLWITSLPSAAIPISILQNSVKMTNEPPAGIKANLRRSYATYPLNDPTFFEGSNKPHVFKKLLFGLCFIHAFVQERRNFGPIGWNVPYGFDDGDLMLSVRQLRMYIDTAGSVPFDALRYAIGECNYGGRVTDDKDRRLLATLLHRVFCPSALRAGFQLSEDKAYCIPEDSELGSYQIYIESLPQMQQPQAFGLHANAGISTMILQVSALLTTLIRMNSHMHMY